MPLFGRQSQPKSCNRIVLRDSVTQSACLTDTIACFRVTLFRGLHVPIESGFEVGGSKLTADDTGTDQNLRLCEAGFGRPTPHRYPFACRPLKKRAFAALAAMRRPLVVVSHNS